MIALTLAAQMILPTPVPALTTLTSVLAPPAPKISGNYNVNLVQLKCENKESLLLRDNVYGLFFYVSLDPANPGILSKIAFNAGKMSRNKVVKFTNAETMRAVPMSEKKEFRWLIGVGIEDGGKASGALTKVFPQAIKNKLPQWIGKTQNPLTLGSLLRIELRKLMKEERKWLKNDDGLIDIVSKFVEDGHLALAAKEPAVLNFNMLGIGAPTGIGRYSGYFHITEAK